MTKEIKTVLIFGLIFSVLAACAFYFVNETKKKKDAKALEITALKTEIASLAKQAALEEGLAQELESLKLNFAQYVKILPSPEVATEEILLSMLQEKSERSQFGLQDFQEKKSRAKPTSKKRGKKKSGGFKEIDITLKANATFEQFLRFLNSLERHESFLRINSFTCNAPQKPEVDEEGKETWPLKISLNISTFRYGG